jgi:hypothetical protein
VTVLNPRPHALDACPPERVPAAQVAAGMPLADLDHQALDFGAET